MKPRCPACTTRQHACFPKRHLGSSCAMHTYMPAWVQVDGCMEDLSLARPYMRDRRCCATHMREASVHVGGEAMRFCVQCHK